MYRSRRDVLVMRRALGDVFTFLHCTEYAVLLKRYSGILNSMVSADMDFTQLDAFLTSQMKKRQVGWE